MDLREFHNGLRILLNIEPHELLDAGVIGFDDLGDRGTCAEFQRDPLRFFIRSSDERVQKLWVLMQKRMRP